MREPEGSSGDSTPRFRPFEDARTANTNQKIGAKDAEERRRGLDCKLVTKHQDGRGEEDEKKVQSTRCTSQD